MPWNQIYEPKKREFFDGVPLARSNPSTTDIYTGSEKDRSSQSSQTVARTGFD